MGFLTALKYLSLSDNNLMGPLLPNLNQLPNLTRLLLKNNELDGMIEPSLCDLNIVWDSADFSIGNNRFCPAYPACINALMGSQDTSMCN